MVSGRLVQHLLFSIFMIWGLSHACVPNKHWVILRSCKLIAFLYHMYTYTECLFLQYGEDLRRCPMPSPITLSTIKNLFVNMFGLSPSLLEDTQCSILLREKDSQQWRLLGNTR